MRICLPEGPAMRTCFTLILRFLSRPLVPLHAQAAEMGTSSESTVAETRCVREALLAMDRDPEKALARVASEASQVPSETFQALWRDNLTYFDQMSADPKEEVKAFRAERRKVSANARSVSFQGTGYGIDTTRCELELTLSPLEQLRS
jgi:hypothetical protein